MMLLRLIDRRMEFTRREGARLVLVMKEIFSDTWDRG